MNTSSLLAPPESGLGVDALAELAGCDRRLGWWVGCGVREPTAEEVGAA